MKVRLRTCAASMALAIACTAAVPSTASAGVFNDLMRHFGAGWSDGYHARSASQAAPASYEIIPLDEAQPVETKQPTHAAESAQSKRPVSPSVTARREAQRRNAEIARQRQSPLAPSPRR